MDCQLSPSTKKRRVASNINIPTIECKREFILPHKFPSTIQPKYNFTVKNGIVATNQQIDSKFKSGGLTVPQNIKKWRIQTIEGRDLGEIKVQFLSQKNVVNNLKAAYRTQSVTQSKPSPVNFSLLPPKEINGLSSTADSTSCKETGQLCVKSGPSKQVAVVINEDACKVELEDKKAFQKCSTLVKVTKIDKNKVLVLHQNKDKLLHSVQTYKENKMSKQNSAMLLNKKKEQLSSNEGLVVPKINTCSTINPTASHQKDKSEKKMLKPKFLQLAASKFPMVRCEKLMISRPKSSIEILSPSTMVRDKGKPNFDAKSNSAKTNAVSNGKVQIIKLKNSSDNSKSFSREDKSSAGEKFDNRTNDNTNDVVILYDENENKKEKEVTPLCTSTKNLCCKSQSTPNNATASSVSSNDSSTCINKSTGDKERKVESSTKGHEETTNNIRKDKLLECLDVIKTALISVTDADLRAKALKALADCGIGVGKKIPVVPSHQLKTVHDSKVQTDIFGLLDMQSFILVNEKLPTLERITQTERSSINLPTVSVETQTRTSEVQVKTVSNNLIDNVNLFPMWNAIPVETTEDVEEYFKDYFVGNQNVHRVEKALSTPRTAFNKIAIQIEKDYNELRKRDENGLLNIHRAVLDNQLQEVHRLLVILQASKINIDEMTENNETSLELAIKCNASESIVMSLLKAGANPTSQELLHESAIILASKLSSQLLPHLLNYVTDKALLNRVDSSGMAALHYCTLNGNLEGVRVLIEAGADVNLRDNRSGRSAFFHALENNQKQIANKLLENGAIADLPNFSGQSVLNLKADEVKCFLAKAALKFVQT